MGERLIDVASNTVFLASYKELQVWFEKVPVRMLERLWKEFDPNKTNSFPKKDLEKLVLVLLIMYARSKSYPNALLLKGKMPKDQVRELCEAIGEGPENEDCDPDEENVITSNIFYS
eukprot:UN25069